MGDPKFYISHPIEHSVFFLEIVQLLCVLLSFGYPGISIMSNHAFFFVLGGLVSQESLLDLQLVPIIYTIYIDMNIYQHFQRGAN